MKKWSIPAIAILAFFGVLSAIFSSIGKDANKNTLSNETSKAARALVDSSPANDTTGVAAVSRDRIVTKSDVKVPAWGALKAYANPTTESMTFSGTKTPQGLSATAKKAKIDKGAKKKKKKKKKGTDYKKIKRPTAIAKKTEEKNEDIDSVGAVSSSDLNAQKDPNKPPQTVEEWFDKITNPVSSKYFMEFLSLYNARLIDENTFYGVCDKLVASPWAQVRKFGYNALGSTPSLNSFLRIAKSLDKENVPELQQFIGQSIQMYLSFNYVTVLPSAFSAQDQSTRLQAALIIGQSAEINIRPGGNGSGTAGRGRPVGGSAHNGVYLAFVPVLERVSSTDQSGEVRDAARRAAQVIQTLANSTAVTSL